jgi:hypothetical protein
MHKRDEISKNGKYYLSKVLVNGFLEKYINGKVKIKKNKFFYLKI